MPNGHVGRWGLRLASPSRGARACETAQPVLRMGEDEGERCYAAEALALALSRRRREARVGRPESVRGVVAIWRLLASVALAMALLVAAPAGAAPEQPAAKRMKVSVWPEYDEPRVLVIYEGEFADGGSFPRKVSFRLPAGAEVSQVCALKPGGEHLCQLYEIARDENGSTLTYELPIPTFFLEFYYNPVEGAGERSIPYEFTPLSAVDSLQIEVQQPARATDFALDPPTSSVQSDGVGLKYFLYDFGRAAAGVPVKVGIRYAKPDANPSTEKRLPAPAAGAGGDGSFAVVWVVIGVGVVAVGIIVGYSLYSRRPTRPRYERAHGGGRPLAPSQVPASSRGKPKGGIRFCSTCGDSVGPGARFCASCGEPVRR